jgi:hypothetical protein
MMDDQKILNLGLSLAASTDWDGRDVFLICLAALEDSNYHKVSRALIDAWESVEGKL